jgi:hypothetical protein
MVDRFHSRSETPLNRALDYGSPHNGVKPQSKITDRRAENMAAATRWQSGFLDNLYVSAIFAGSPIHNRAALLSPKGRK